MLNIGTHFITEIGGVPTFWGIFTIYNTECREGWNDDTTNKYDQILCNHIIPNLKNHNKRTIDSYTLDELEAVIATIQKNGQNGAGCPYVPYDEKTIQGFLFAIKRIIAVAARHYLCEDVFAAPNTKQSKKKANNQFTKTRKTLTTEQEIAVLSYFGADPTQPGEQMAMFLMYILGVRNGEACGYNFGHITQMLTYPDCWKIRMLETTKIGTNAQQPGGKTGNAPRYSPLIDFAINFLLARREYVKTQLMSNGVTDFKIDELPIACVGNNYRKRCSARDITDAARKMFVALGFRHDTLCSINQQRLMKNAQIKETIIENADDLVENDLTAYILRRTFATHLAVLGMEQSKSEYLIGHTIQSPYDTRNDLSHEDTLYEIKLELEKRPLVGSNCLNRVPVETAPGMCINISKSNTQTYIVPAKASCVQLSITAKEPGDDLRITITPTDMETPIVKERSIYYATPVQFPRTIDINTTYQRVYNKKSE